MASGTVLPFSAISGRSIVNLAISASASAGVAMPSSTATNVSVIPAPSSKALRRVSEDIALVLLGGRPLAHCLPPGKRLRRRDICQPELHAFLALVAVDHEGAGGVDLAATAFEERSAEFLAG